MFEEISVSEEIKTIVEDLIIKRNFKPITDLKYYKGSRVGDGYGSKTVAVDVRNEEDSLHLFLKCAKDNIKDAEKVHTDKIYANEIYFYKTIYPTYTKFLADRGIRDGFQNVPKYYGAATQRFNEIIILENLRGSGYTLFDKFKFMDDDHLTLVLKTFAKFHGVSFAIKDQMPETHDEMCDNCFDVNISMKEMGFYNILTDMINDFLAKLDPIADKDILDKCGNIVEKIIDCMMNKPNYESEYWVLTKGDCWSNNMMILYEDQLEENPIDVMLIDWQLVRRASPVHDLMNLFYSVVSKEALENSDRYLKIYHDELSKRISELGSDPDVLYPYHAFEAEWKKLVPFGYGIAILLIKMMLSETEERPNFEGMVDCQKFDNIEDFIPSIKKENEYMRRVKYITRYLIKNKLL